MMTSDTNFIEFILGIKDSKLIFRGYFYKWQIARNKLTIIM